jgi:hypothetical protein
MGYVGRNTSGQLPVDIFIKARHRTFKVGNIHELFS